MPTPFKKITFLVLAAGLVLSGCRKDSESQGNTSALDLATVLENQGQPAAINDTLRLSNGRDFVLRKFKLYLSNINLVKVNGSKTKLSDVFLADVGDANTGRIRISEISSEENYQSIEFGLGLDSVQNDSDPTSFPLEHPLSTFNQMYWSMLKYRFAIVEGRSNVADSLGNTQSDVLHAYHPGTDPLYKEVTLPLPQGFNQQLDNSNSPNLKIVVDIDQLFTNAPAIDMVNEPQTHSEPVDIATAIKFMNNLQAAVKLELE